MFWSTMMYEKELANYMGGQEPAEVIIYHTFEQQKATWNLVLWTQEFIHRGVLPLSENLQLGMMSHLTTVK